MPGGETIVCSIVFFVLVVLLVDLNDFQSKPAEQRTTFKNEIMIYNYKKDGPLNTNTCCISCAAWYPNTHPINQVK